MKKSSSLFVRIFTLFLLTLLVSPVLLSASPALAQTAAASFSAAGSDANDNALTSVMCKVLKLVTGTAGKAFAAFAIISVGIGFFTGKVSWGLMVGVAAGIAAMFGAPSIVAAITGESAFNCN